MTTELYPQHLLGLCKQYQSLMSSTDIDHVIISSGSQSYYFHDDHTHPFKAYAGAQQWLPFVARPDLFILISREGKPRLLWPDKPDFWHTTARIPDGDWQSLWQIDTARALKDWIPALQGSIAWLGPLNAQQDSLGIRMEMNPDRLLLPLYYQRAIKSDYEIACMELASIKGVKGHLAAEAGFLAGKSEAEIYLDFLSASEQLSINEPYPGIVCLNQAAAILHYEHKQWQKPDMHRSMLIDAGASHLGYCSDITRTYCNNRTPDGALFEELLNQMEALEHRICAAAVAGTDYQNLHQTGLREIAAVLLNMGICTLSVDEQMDKRIPQVFSPHGLGHLIGLQVHDVAGHQIDALGTLLKPGDDAPFLRLTRRLESNMAITIEPGLYFIPMLLDRMVREIPQHGCNLELIERLKPFGGIRVEDNLVIADTQSRNLTREAYQALKA